jgi:hypothetical protein
MPNVIHFYNPCNTYGEFSNFYVRPIIVGGKEWPTSEHFFQAMKSNDPDVQEHVRAIKTPGEAKRYGHTIQLYPEWERSVEVAPQLAGPLRDEHGLVVDKFKDYFMFQALTAKFTQHVDLGQLLLTTGDARLVEHTDRDSYWGDGFDLKGQNKLGRMLMLVRKSLPRHLGG